MLYLFTFNKVGSEEVLAMGFYAELRSDAEQSFDAWVEENNYDVENVNVVIASRNKKTV